MYDKWVGLVIINMAPKQEWQKLPNKKNVHISDAISKHFLLIFMHSVLMHHVWNTLKQNPD